MIADGRNRPGLLGQHLVALLLGAEAEDPLEAQAAAYRLAEVINAIHATLSKRPARKGPRTSAG